MDWKTLTRNFKQRPAHSLRTAANPQGNAAFLLSTFLFILVFSPVIIDGILHTRALVLGLARFFISSYSADRLFNHVCPRCRSPPFPFDFEPISKNRTEEKQ